LAARAATTQLAPEKEAAVAAILDKMRSLRAYATDTNSFDRNLGAVEDALPDALNG
jgi:type IV secretion system protein VirD4